jgi:IS30 family transposase
MTTRKPRKAVAPADIKEFQRLKKEGFNIGQIAELTEFSPATVGRHLKNAKPSGKNLTQEARAMIVKQRESGMTFEAIAMLHHCAPSTTHRVYNEETGRYKKRVKRGESAVANKKFADGKIGRAANTANKQSTLPWGAIAMLAVLAGIAALAI